jgi:hypothetical protein
MKRLAVLLVASLPALALAFAAQFAVTARLARCAVDVRPERVALLKVGMRESDVDAILGAPPGDYRKYKSGWVLCVVERPYLPVGGTRREWRTDNVVVEVGFDAQGEVVYIGRRETTPPHPWYGPLRDMLRDLAPSFCRLGRNLFRAAGSPASRATSGARGPGMVTDPG